MRCGAATADDCAIAHWGPLLDARRESSGQWRAPCPVCKADRGLQFDAPGKAVRWNSFCGYHDMDAMRPVLLELLGDCMPSRASRRAPIDHDALTALALSGMPAMSLRLALLEMAGMGTRDALDKLGVRRQHRPRTIAGRTAGVTNFGAKAQDAG